MKRHYNVVVERDEEGYFVGSVPSLPGCHTQARSLDQLMERIKEAIELYLDATNESAEMSTLDFVGVHQITVDR